MIDYSKSAQPKPEPRKRTRARAKRQASKHVREVRAYVFDREKGVCRICNWRLADSMHEIIPRSLGGKASHQNSIAVCGDGVRGCHGFAQRHEIYVKGNAEGRLRIAVSSAAAKAWVNSKDCCEPF